MKARSRFSFKGIQYEVTKMYKPNYEVKRQALARLYGALDGSKRFILTVPRRIEEPVTLTEAHRIKGRWVK